MSALANVDFSSASSIAQFHAMGNNVSSATPPLPYIFSCASNRWVECTSAPAASSVVSPATPLRVYTWNIDFASPCSVQRMRRTLDHLADHLASTAPPSASSPASNAIILLQEVHVAALPVLLEHEFVRDHFATTNILAPAPHGSYMTLTLVARDVPVAAVRRIVFEGSMMGRDCLLVELPVSASGDGDGDGDGGEKSKVKRVLRIGNTHLESLPIGQPHRLAQLRIISAALNEAGGVAGVVAGDMNAISAEDATYLARADVQLKDAWHLDPRSTPGEEGRGDDGDEEVGERRGYTWGYQPRCRFPCGRLDKILYTGDVSFVSLHDGEDKLLERVGVDVVCEEPAGEGRGEEEEAAAEESSWPLAKGEKRWVSDHYGLAVGVRVGSI